MTLDITLSQKLTFYPISNDFKSGRLLSYLMRPLLLISLSNSEGSDKLVMFRIARNLAAHNQKVWM